MANGPERLGISREPGKNPTAKEPKGPPYRRLDWWEKKAWDILHEPLMQNADGKPLSDEEILKLPDKQILEIERRLHLHIYPPGKDNPENRFKVTRPLTPFKIPHALSKRRLIPEKKIDSLLADGHRDTVRKTIILIRKSLEAPQILPNTLQVTPINKGLYQAHVRMSDGSIKVILSSITARNFTDAKKEAKAELRNLK